jgi:hypothetical protein
MTDDLIRPVRGAFPGPAIEPNSGIRDQLALLGKVGVRYGGLGVALSLLDNLVAYWKLDETSGPRIDSAGSNNLADNGSVGSATGKVGNAADFDGTNYLSTPNNATFSPTSHFTVTAWVRPETTPSGDQGIAGVWQNSIGGRQWLLYLGNGDPALFVSVNGSSNTAVFYPITLAASTWYFFAAGYDGSNIFISVNAGTLSTTSFVGPIWDSSTDLFYISTYDNATKFFTGRIDEIGLWHRALTPEEIAILYNGGAGTTFPF